MRLKEILAERKRATNVSAPDEPQTPNTDNQVAVVDELLPNYVFATPFSEFQALFEGCEDF